MLSMLPASPPRPSPTPLPWTSATAKPRTLLLLLLLAAFLRPFAPLVLPFLFTPAPTASPTLLCPTRLLVLARLPSTVSPSRMPLSSPASPTDTPLLLLLAFSSLPSAPSAPPCSPLPSFRLPPSRPPSSLPVSARLAVAPSTLCVLRVVGLPTPRVPPLEVLCSKAVSGRGWPGRQGHMQARELLPSNSVVPLPLPARWSDPDPLKAAFPFADVVASKGGAGITGGVLLAFLDFPELLGLYKMHAEAFKNASSLSRRRMTSASNVAPELKMVESYKKRI
mmetsp:Transcript_3507/g.9405  ORF Transcript_3507/g.9405 Transcript_3507/m.9405 type:complete len:280 (+) Transcript_3507:1747-2586(+)